MPLDRSPVCDQAELVDQSVTDDVGPFRDMPRWIWITFLSAWAIFFALLALFFATTPSTGFVITIAVLFGAMAFGLPITLAAQSKCIWNECPDTIDTHTGPLDVKAAGAQIVLIPVCAVIGLVAFIVLAF